jgi:hypothetical protein
MECGDQLKSNQYIFGGTLLVAPIIRPADKRTNLAHETVWLPEGRWTDIFNGRIYNGGRQITMYRDLDSIPVLAPEGAIVPMYRDADTNNLSLDQPLEIHLWRGNGEYELYEDDGETTAYKNGVFAKTRFELAEKKSTVSLTITPPADSKGLLPEKRKMYIIFRDVKSAVAPAEYNPKKLSPKGGIELEIEVGREPITIKLTDVIPTENPSFKEHCEEILTRTQGRNDLKNIIFKKQKNYPAAVWELFDKEE